jgi:wyosine [tRNA(Phe)-imidazoG37] synthetase (radical SAM superfamily)
MFKLMGDLDEINRDVLALQNGCVYGPVNSRRLKNSLGLNVLPKHYKLCSFNCIYCQYGLTRASRLIREPSRDEIFPSVDAVEEAVISAIKKVKEEILYLTFSGNGEATLHPDFPQLVDMLIGVRDKYLPSTRTAILSNSTMLDHPEIVRALQKIDTPIMKLDAGTQDLFQNMNRPAEGITIDSVVKGLIDFNHSGLIIQSMMLGSKYFNTTDQNIEKWSLLLKVIKPSEVHIYSLERPSALINVIKVESDELKRIAAKAGMISGMSIKAY